MQSAPKFHFGAPIFALIMPVIFWISEAFPVSQEPFTLPEVIRRLHLLYSPSVTKDAVYRAVRTLRNSPVTAPLVVPLDNARPALYSAESARRIARRVTRSAPPIFPASEVSTRVGK